MKKVSNAINCRTEHCPTASFYHEGTERRDNRKINKRINKMLKEEVRMKYKLEHDGKSMESSSDEEIPNRTIADFLFCQSADPETIKK